MKKSSVLQNKKVARQRNRRLKRRQRSLRQWLARLAKTRHSLASFVAAREPAPAGARGFYKGGPPPRRRSPIVERLLWSGTIEYRQLPQNFGGQPWQKPRPRASTEAPLRLPALTPAPWVDRVIVCSKADFLGDHRRLSPLSSRVSVGWGPLPDAGALRVITPAPVPDRLFSAQFQSRARGQEGLGSFAPEGLPEKPWPLENCPQRPLVVLLCSSGDPAASWGRRCHVVLEATPLKPEKLAVDDVNRGRRFEQRGLKNHCGGRKKICHETLGSNNFFREGTGLNRSTKYLRKTRGIGKSYRPYKKTLSRKALSGAKNQRHSLGKTKSAVPQVGEWLGAAGGTSLRKHKLLQALLREVRTTNRTGSHSDHFTRVPLAAVSLRKEPSLKSCYGYQFMPDAFDGNWRHLNREERDEIQEILHCIKSNRHELWWLASVCGERVPEEVFQALYFVLSRFDQPGLDRREQVIDKILWRWFSDLVSIDIFAEKKSVLPWIACDVGEARIEEFKASIRASCQEEYRHHASFEAGEISSEGFDGPRNRTASFERFMEYRQHLAQGMASMLEDFPWMAICSSGDHDNPKSKRLVDNGGGAALCLDCRYLPPFRPVGPYGY